MAAFFCLGSKKSWIERRFFPPELIVVVLFMVRYNLFLEVECVYRKLFGNLKKYQQSSIIVKITMKIASMMNEG